jgi:O-antigen ligase
VLCINGAVLSLEGALQRLSGTNELLWSVKPRFNVVARAQFGPFNYRSNGAQYLNMLWPIAFGFWWALHQRAKRRLGESAEFILFPLAAIMVAGPVISLSRGGVAIAVLQSVAVIGVFAYAFRKAAWWKIGAVALLFGAVAASAAMLQWSAITVRLNENSYNTMSGRSEIYANSKKIVEDYPVWGTGPGTFGVVYQLYREDPTQIWFAAAHDDFLQTRITFGTVGLTIAMIILALVVAHWWFGKGIAAPIQFVSFFWIAFAGCLIHARFDFPLQLYSLLLLFLTICASLTVLGKK